MLQHNPVMAAKYKALTQAAGEASAAADAGPRKASTAAAAARAARARARVACAASLLRWIYCMVVHGTTWDAEIAAGNTASSTASRPAGAAA